ncbi:hypothetical protein BZA05DRAFT_31993 [Tricharina praecox]|uniref:uncharacterized protein n=1 Tax=Tricharina praecox TaxID=43433 RepID=UPI002220D209|nr:uncharacterized protein BZA05DRAFT_31993 [Tricharina praecox]KAI5853518.1 hypothetical protein BZA05DRAFT_31993 [Tricharina praecox]
MLFLPRKIHAVITHPSFGLQFYVVSMLMWWFLAFSRTMDVRVSTMPVLADCEEQQWGFGQIFPMLMLLNLLLNTVDAWKEFDKQSLARTKTF